MSSEGKGEKLNANEQEVKQDKEIKESLSGSNMGQNQSKQLETSQLNLSAKKREFGFVIEVLLELDKSCGDSRPSESALETQAVPNESN